MQQLIFVVFLSFFTSCALRVDYKMPNHRFMDPETRGVNIWQERSGFISTHLANSQELVLSSVSTPLVFNGDYVSDEQVFEESAALGIQAGLGLFSFLDIHYRADHDAPSMVLTKLQLFGGHGKEAKVGHKLAIWSGVGSMSETDSLDVSNSDGTSKRSYKGELSVRAWEAGLSYGYRFNPRLLTYINLVHARFNANSLLTSSTNPNVVVRGMTNQNAANLGLKLGYNTRAYGLFELGYSQVEWRESQRFKNDSLSFGASFGLGF